MAEQEKPYPTPQQQTRQTRTPGAGGSSDTEPVDGAQADPKPQNEQSEEERKQNEELLSRHRANAGGPISDLERERILTVGPSYLGMGPQPRDKSLAQTVNGPLDYDDQVMEKDLWKQQQKAHIDRNNSEVERATQEADQAGYGPLIAVRSGLTGEHADRVAFTEMNPMHPHGYAYVAGRDSSPVLIAKTPLVAEALFNRRIQQVDAPLPQRSQQNSEQQGVRA